MVALSVNVNKIAWLRNARQGSIPNLRECCQTIVAAGAQGLTVHPRPDQRHITVEDVAIVKQVVVESPGIEFNMEGNPDNGIEANGYPGFLTLVSQAHPDQCTLVPDTNDQLTSNHGWDLYVEDNRRRLVDYIEELHSNNIRVSIFLDPDVALVEHAATIGIDRIELYTGPWVECVREQGLNSDDANKCLHLYTQAADRAYDRGLKVNAGHDLDLENLRTFASRVKVDEVSIGHALISDALFYGLTATVEKYLDRLSI